LGHKASIDFALSQVESLVIVIGSSQKSYEARNPFTSGERILMIKESLNADVDLGIINHTFKEYRPMHSLNLGERKLGVLVSMENGKTTAYALGALEDRGVMFVEPTTDVYEGMIVGEHTRENDLAVNPVKGKNLTNTRTSSKDHTVVLKRPRIMTLEICLDYINSDELVEVTPKNVRLRKKIIDTNERKKFDSRTK
jgi:GTP-binding protein